MAICVGQMMINRAIWEFSQHFLTKPYLDLNLQMTKIYKSSGKNWLKSS